MSEQVHRRTAIAFLIFGLVVMLTDVFFVAWSSVNSPSWYKSAGPIFFVAFVVGFSFLIISDGLIHWQPLWKLIRPPKQPEHLKEAKKEKKP
jgi:uncharacterized membrane protein YidH (DUF202 family)